MTVSGDQNITAGINEINDSLGANTASEFDHIRAEQNQMIIQILAVFAQRQFWVISQLEGDLEAAGLEGLEKARVGFTNSKVVQKRQHSFALAIGYYAR